MNNLVTGTTLLMYTVVGSWLGKAGDPSTRDSFLHINGVNVATLARIDLITAYVK